jgi:hypothetical protein
VLRFVDIFMYVLHAYSPLQGTSVPQGHIHLTYTASSPGGVQEGGSQVSEQQALELAQVGKSEK